MHAKARHALATDDVVDSVLVATRALMAIAARSLASADNTVTLVQFRAVVVLWTGGPHTISELAGALETAPSSTTRLADRLERKGLVQRLEALGDRRERVIGLTEQGTTLAATVNEIRRREIRAIIETMTAAEHGVLVDALGAFAAAAGEPSTPAWWIGTQQ